MTRPLYIFDLDGTLANIEHRLHYISLRPGSRVRVDSRPGTCIGVTPSATPQHFNVVLDDTLESAHYDARSVQFRPDWDKFHAACVDDKPIPEMIELLRMLDQCSEPPCEVRIWSGRTSWVQPQTRKWLLRQGVSYWELKMRPHGDYTPDDQLKESWLHALPPEDRARLRMVFDDRRRVVDMWRRNGVRCLHVAEGEF